MSCSTCGCHPCQCGSATNCPQQCECPDNGSLAAGRHLEILDYRLCPKRLDNPDSGAVLVNNPTGSGQGNIVWTDAPCIPLPELELETGVAFPNLMAALGDAGCWRELIPADGVSGFLQAIDGQWQISDAPVATVPDPLTVDNLSVTDVAVVKELSITTSLCFTTVPEGTAVSAAGFDADGCLVKQASGGGGVTPLGTAMALYYENPDETSTATPNDTIADGGYAVIGNEISDAAGIAHVQDQFTIKIDIAGSYLVEWTGVFGTPSSQRDVQLSLEINGGTAIPGSGDGRTNNTSPQVRFCLFGMTIKTFAVNDVVKLKCTSSVASNNKLQKAKLLLVRYGS